MLSATAAFEMMRRASRRARRRWPALQDSDFHEVDREDVRAISLSSRAEVRSDDKASPEGRWKSKMGDVVPPMCVCNGGL